jgi:hypothetical protein
MRSEVGNPVVAFDESGNTGQDLLNPHQPVFVLASVCLDDAAESQVTDLLGGTKSKEVHFSRLKLRPDGQRRILDVLRSPLIVPTTVKVCIYHKGFMVTTKIVDLLVETLAFKHGFDLYRQGLNIAMSNLHHLLMPRLCGEKAFRHFQQCFVTMIRKHDSDSRDSFYAQLRTLIKTCAFAPYCEDLKLIEATREVVDEVLSQCTVTDLDPAVPSFVVLCGDWGDEFGRPFDVAHDISKPIDREREALQLLMANDEPRVTVGYDRRKARLPLLATGINFIGSHEAFQVQLADVIAGAMAYWASGMIGRRVDSAFFRELGRTNLRQLVVLAVWPSAAVTPKDLGTEGIGGIQTVEYVTEMILRQKAKRGKT